MIKSDGTYEPVSIQTQIRILENTIRHVEGARQDWEDALKDLLGPGGCYALENMLTYQKEVQEAQKELDDLMNALGGM